jgi:hypothetical protein
MDDLNIKADKRTSEEWAAIILPSQNMHILDPDGWDRKNWHYSWYEELITAIEFTSRLLRSTCQHHPELDNALKAT